MSHLPRKKRLSCAFQPQSLLTGLLPKGFWNLSPLQDLILLSHGCAQVRIRHSLDILLRPILTILGFYRFVLLYLLVNCLSVSIDVDQEYILDMPTSIYIYFLSYLSSKICHNKMTKLFPCP